MPAITRCRRLPDRAAYVKRDFLNLADAGADGIAAMIADALDRKAARAGWPKAVPDADAPLAGHVLATTETIGLYQKQPK